ncbi:hypothetical protein [Streptomyces sp. NPDC126514]
MTGNRVEQHLESGPGLSGPERRVQPSPDGLSLPYNSVSSPM